MRYYIDMSQAVKKQKQPARRPYRSEHRAQQARETRRAVREAAAQLFVAHGYAGTSIATIAEAAGVSPETVYATFKNKRALLKEVIDVTIAGDDEPVPVADRPWIDDARGESDQRRRLAIITGDGLGRLARVAPILDVLRGAAATDPDLAELWTALERGRRYDISIYTELIRERGPLRDDEEVLTDVVWAIAGPEVYLALVRERGWTHEQYVAQMQELIERICLPESG
jgi:AcrR family transcriptional regulator